MKNILPALNILHVLNDGLQASLLLLLPFIAKDFRISLTAVGFLGTALGLMGVMAAVPAGELARKVGGVKMLIFLTLFYGLGFVGVSIAPTVLVLWPFFLAAGIGFGVFHPIALAVMARAYGKEGQGRRLGNFMAVGEVGRVVIPFAISFLVAFIGLRLTASLYALLAVAVFLLFYFIHLPKTAPPQAPVNPITILRTRHLLRNRGFVYATLAGALDCFASASLFVFLPFLFLTKQISPVVLGPFTAAFFAGNFFGKVYLGRLTDRLGTTWVFIACEVAMAGFIGLLILATSPLAIVAVSVVLGALTRGTVPVSVAMLADTLPHDAHHEKAYGINTVVVGSAITVAPLVLGAVSDHFGIVAAFELSALVALLAIAPAVAYGRQMRRAG